MKFKKSKPVPQPQKLRMKANHTWKAPDGYKIIVLDRGAVSFNIPVSWHMAQLEPHLELNDKPPPNDDARISVSLWHLPRGVDWSGLPLGPLLEKAVDESEFQILQSGDVTRWPRSDIELVWMERRFMDEKEPREAYTRNAAGRGFDVQVLITCDYWVTDAPRIRPIWDEVMRSLQLGRFIADPTRGDLLH